MYCQYGRNTIEATDTTSQKPFERIFNFDQTNCRNNHSGFIPINEFKISHLPSRYQYEEIYRSIKSLSMLTARLVVSKNGNGQTKRLGTGTVQSVYFYDMIDAHGTRILQYAKIEVKTAHHVVGNDWNSSRITAQLFYDDDHSRESVSVLHGNRIVAANLDEDWCIFACYTWDLQLANCLNYHLGEFLRQSIRINEMFHGSPDLAVIVSHPHGGPKHVSVGALTVREPERCVHTGNGVLIIVDVTLADIVTGDYAEEVGIECEIWFPDETTSLYPLWQMDRLVRHTKHELFMQGGLRNFREDDMYMELELPEGQRQVMDDTKSLDYYKDDLSQAFRICFKQKPLDFGNSVAFKTNRASPVC